MTVRMRHTRSHTKNRRSHHALDEPRLSKCSKCSAMHVRHRMCSACGYYKGREVVNVMAKVLKKNEKNKKVEKKSNIPNITEGKPRIEAKDTKKSGGIMGMLKQKSGTKTGDK